MPPLRDVTLLPYLRFQSRLKTTSVIYFVACHKNVQNCYFYLSFQETEPVIYFVQPLRLFEVS